MKKKNPIQIKPKFVEYEGIVTVWGGSWLDDPSDIALYDFYEPDVSYNFEIESSTNRQVTLSFRICRTTKEQK